MIYVFSDFIHNRGSLAKSCFRLVLPILTAAALSSFVQAKDNQALGASVTSSQIQTGPGGYVRDIEELVNSAVGDIWALQNPGIPLTADNLNGIIWYDPYSQAIVTPTAIPSRTLMIEGLDGVRRNLGSYAEIYDENKINDNLAQRVVWVDTQGNEQKSLPSFRWFYEAEAKVSFPASENGRIDSGSVAKLKAAMELTLQDQQLSRLFGAALGNRFKSEGWKLERNVQAKWRPFLDRYLNVIEAANGTTGNVSIRLRKSGLQEILDPKKGKFEVKIPVKFPTSKDPRWRRFEFKVYMGDHMKAENVLARRIKNNKIHPITVLENAIPEATGSGVKTSVYINDRRQEYVLVSPETYNPRSKSSERVRTYLFTIDSVEAVDETTERTGGFAEVEIERLVPSTRPEHQAELLAMINAFMAEFRHLSIKPSDASKNIAGMAAIKRAKAHDGVTDADALVELPRSRQAAWKSEFEETILPALKDYNDATGSASKTWSLRLTPELQDKLNRLGVLGSSSLHAIEVVSPDGKKDLLGEPEIAHIPYNLRQKILWATNDSIRRNTPSTEVTTRRRAINGILSTYNIEGATAGQDKDLPLPLQRLLRWTGHVQELFVTLGRDDEDKFDAKRFLRQITQDSSGRRKIFWLENYLHFYRAHPKLGKKAEKHYRQVKALEDLIGDYKDLKDFREIVEKLPVKPDFVEAQSAIVASLRKDEAKALQVAIKFMETGKVPDDYDQGKDGLSARTWVPNERGRVEALEKLANDMSKAMLKVDWSKKPEKQFSEQRFISILNDLAETNYDMKLLEMGVHELRRDIRRMLYQAFVMDGMVQLDWQNHPIPEVSEFAAPHSSEAKSRYLGVPPSDREIGVIRFPTSLFARLVRTVSVFGDMKDRAQLMEVLTQRLIDTGYSQDHESAEHMALKMSPPWNIENVGEVGTIADVLVAASNEYAELKSLAVDRDKYPHYADAGVFAALRDWVTAH